MQINYFVMFYTLLGGLGLFLYGMNQMSQGLQSLGSQMIKKAINYITANRIYATLVGVLVTCFVQSSSVSTVMMSSFVNAGLMNLTQAVGFIFGANIGTTITGWIISLSVGKYGLLLIGIGVLPMLFSSNSKIKNLSRLFFALGLVFCGLETMGKSFEPLRSSKSFHHLMTYFSASSHWSVLVCMITGCVLTMIIQSSSAMLGITIALATQGAIEFPTAAALVLGENIGTTITLWIASIGANTQTKRTALAHSSFNISGCLIIFCIFPFYLKFIDWLMLSNPYTIAADGTRPHVATHIAAVHTCFNLLMTIIWLPLLQYLVKFVEFVIPDRKYKEAEKFTYFGNIRNLSPVMAIEEAQMVTEKMADKTAEAIDKAGRFLLSTEMLGELSSRVKEIETATDEMQKEITIFLSKVLLFELDESQTASVNSMIRISDELESICDYCANVVKYRERLFENNIPLQPETSMQLSQYLTHVQAFYAAANEWIKEDNEGQMMKFTERYQTLNDEADKIRDHHLKMLKMQKYPPIFALTFSDIMIALRRIKNHTLNVGEALNGRSTKY